MSDRPPLQGAQTPEERRRLAAAVDAMQAAGPLPDGVSVELGFLDADAQIRQMHADEAAAFLPAAEFAATPDGVPVFRVDFPPVAHALRAYPVEVTQHGVTNALAGVPMPLSLYARFRVDGQWEFPIYVTLEKGPDGIADLVIDRGVFLVFDELGPDAPYVRFDRMHRFNQPTVVDPKLGRNDPCPCGSGKKLKRCHGS